MALFSRLASADRPTTTSSFVTRTIEYVYAMRCRGNIAGRSREENARCNFFATLCPEVVRASFLLRTTASPHIRSQFGKNWTGAGVDFLLVMLPDGDSSRKIFYSMIHTRIFYSYCDFNYAEIEPESWHPSNLWPHLKGPIFRSAGVQLTLTR